MAKRRKRKLPRDPLAYPRGGTRLTIHVDTEMVKYLDECRVELETEWGVLVDRATMLENLVKRVWRTKMEEAHAFAVGMKITDKIPHGGDE